MASIADRPVFPPGLREILVIHHTHTDIGYTHSPALIWELHRRFIDRALDLCDTTRARPADGRFRWTCECTWPLLRWLEQAAPADARRFRAAVRRGQMGAGALPLHLTPLSDAVSLARGFADLPRLRDGLGLPLRAAIGHDINGLPWPLVGLLRDAGIELLIMGINICFGGFPLTRPAIFRWQGPDGRAVWAVNGQCYNAFNHVARPFLGSTDSMAQGLAAYAARKLPADWPFPFLYLTASHPLYPDNNPPDLVMTDMIARWNAEGRTPAIRLIQPDDLIPRLEACAAAVPTHRGDWTDYWNFGSAALARETAAARGAARRLRAVRQLTALGAAPSDAAGRARLDEAEQAVLLYEEHTWVNSGSVDDPESDEFPASLHRKAAYAWQARDLAAWVLRDDLEQAGGNRGEGPLRGLLLYNPTGRARRVCLRLPDLLARTIHEETAPRETTGEGMATTRKRTWDHLLPRLYQYDMQTDSARRKGNGIEVGPFDVPAYGLRTVPLADLIKRSLPPPRPLRAGRRVLRSDAFTLAFDPATGRVARLAHRELGVVLRAGAWPIFGYVHETPQTGDPRTPLRGREAFFDLDWGKLHGDQDCWRSDWSALREGPTRLLACVARDEAEGETLHLEWAAPGVDWLRQRIVLCRHRPAVVFEATFQMRNTITPEAVYFAFPTPLARGWRAHFDTANLPVELDAEQLPGVCRDYLTVGDWICLHDGARALTLACPDAPLVQPGAFAFGAHRAAVPRPARPLLLGWATNNYWHTNFPPAQPGPLRLRYEFTATRRYDPAACAAFGDAARQPVEAHPLNRPVPRAGLTTVLAPLPEGLVLLDARRADGRLELTLANVTDRARGGALRFPRLVLERLERQAGPPVLAATLAGGALRVRLPPRSLARIVCRAAPARPA